LDAVPDGWVPGVPGDVPDGVPGVLVDEPFDGVVDEEVPPGVALPLVVGVVVFCPGVGEGDRIISQPRMPSTRTAAAPMPA
jgi:hypothetical protein